MKATPNVDTVEFIGLHDRKESIGDIIERNIQKNKPSKKPERTLRLYIIAMETQRYVEHEEIDSEELYQFLWDTFPQLTVRAIRNLYNIANRCADFYGTYLSLVTVSSPFSKRTRLATKGEAYGS